ncbi:hypothetical protein [Polaribacter ponticola]|uniref:Uncharacterized protein n=1 Tax=Polaribacter ponticola TaxID=2978475 RepID=A0ABT5S788_9FLAO|nr:hypothetical protein [Polaribacter sp. MSW5]MDD7913960.1 hypothetical protein [Polaribacter sp. MSW5]
MRDFFIVVISVVVTALNINSYGDLSNEKIQEAKNEASKQTEIFILNLLD